MKKIISLIALLGVLVLSCTSAFAAELAIEIPESWVSTDSTSHYAQLFKNYIGDSFDEDNFFLTNVSLPEITDEYKEQLGSINISHDVCIDISTNSDKDLQFVYGFYLPKEYDAEGNEYPEGFFCGYLEDGETPSDDVKFTINKASSFSQKYCAFGAMNWPQYRRTLIGLQLLNPENLTSETMVTVSLRTEYGNIPLGSVTYPSPVAKVGEVEYATLQGAVNAAGTEATTITLVDNITLEETVKVNAGQKVTLDLNGKTISGSKNDKATANHELILNKGNLTIVDSVGNGKITYEYTGEGTQFATATNVITNDAGAVLTIDGGTLENKTAVTGHASYVIDTRTNGNGGDSTVVINGGNIISTKVAAIRGFANSTTNTVAITVNDGNITGYPYIQDASASANKGVLTIKGGTFTALTDSYAIYQYGTGDASNILTTIMGGTFNGDVYITGNNVTNNFEASITGGTFNDDVWVCAWNNGETTDLKAISGGTFTTDVSDYVAEGYELVANTDGTYGVSLSLPTAEWTAVTDSGYYMNGTNKEGLMRWLFLASINGTADVVGIEYQGATQNTQVFCDTVITDGDVVFYGDVNGFTKNEAAKDSYLARGFVKSGSTINYSDIVTNAPNWDRELDYKGGNE